MIDAALVLGLAALAGQQAGVRPWSALAAAVFSGLLLRRRLGPAVLAAGAAVLLLSWGRASVSLARFDAGLEEARGALGPPSRCVGQARVLSSPVKKGDALRWLGELTGLSCEGRELPGVWRARLYGGPEGLARGDRLEVTASLGVVQLFSNLDTADPRPSAARSGAVMSGAVIDSGEAGRGWGPGAWVDRARARVRGRIVATYPEAAAPLARALVLGEEDLEPEEGEAFRRSGLSHLLAVSGTHLVLVVAGLVGALGALLLRVRALAARGAAGPAAAALGVPLAALYADFAGGSGSAWRAAAMLGALLLARALGRRGDASRALGLSLLLMALVDPLAAFDLSLLLSAAATAGLLWLSRPVEALLAPWVPRLLLGPTATTLAATLACAPLLTSVSPELPLAGLAANLLAVPVGEAAALPLCIFHTIAPGPLERGAAVLGAGALLTVRAIAHRAAAFPGVPLPPLTELQGVILAAGLAGLAAWPRRGAAACLTGAALLLAEGAAVVAGAPRGRLRVTALDVGQGDSLLVDFPDGQAMLLDGGGFVGSPVDPGRSVLLPTLRARRRGSVAIAALSHPHPDHFLGLASALPSVGVGEFWDSGQGDAEGAGPVHAAMMADLRRRGVPVRGPAELCGRPRDLGGARVELLAPCPSFTPFANANDNSLVLRVSYGRRSALLVGDAEGAEEQALLASGRDLRSDLLKVGHHGSRTSSAPGFVAAVRPSLAVISCGVRNRFGHPHPTPLSVFAAAGVPVARTDRGGALLWSTDGDRVTTSRPR